MFNKIFGKTQTHKLSVDLIDIRTQVFVRSTVITVKSKVELSDYIRNAQENGFTVEITSKNFAQLH